MPSLLPFQVVSIIDDDESVRLATANLLRSFGVQSCTFISVEAFLASEYIDRTACVISDMQLPGMNGVELQATLREMQRPIPMVFITAFPDHALRSVARANGATCFLTKPVDGNTILSCIDRAIRGSACDECAPEEHE
ncbi:response regulator [Paraburkholderia jirisanensis]